MNEDARELMEDAQRPQALRPGPDMIDWPDTTGLSDEEAILADAETMVEAGLAEWIEPDDGVRHPTPDTGSRS